MKLQPNRDYVSDDVVQTPPKLARQLVYHFEPTGRILEPCKGAGNFLRALRSYPKTGAAVSKVEWCEVKSGALGAAAGEDIFEVVGGEGRPFSVRVIRYSVGRKVTRSPVTPSGSDGAQPS